MTINHSFYLNLAFQQAEKNIGNTKLNPSVGCVLVKNNTVISSGVTSVYGRPHSEFNALNFQIDYKGSSLYVSLEPCTHHGVTPPCVNLIKKKNVKKVFYCFNDPDKRTFKKAKKILQKKNILTKQLIINKYRDFYKSYLINKKVKLPFISAKIATSKDYYTINKKSKWITNIHSRKITHLIRSKFDCIISTSKSINQDNSRLNCRIEGLNKIQPDLFIIDLNFKLKKKLKLNMLNNQRKTYIITTNKNKKKIYLFKKKGFKFIIINSLKYREDFNFLLKKIFQLGHGRILFETGLTFLNELIKYKFLNNLYLFQNNKKLMKNGSNNVTAKYLKSLRLGNIVKVNLNNDKLYNIRIK
tara:strand:- start:847 stop:1917 length:1071 start_codon:yes stop_codon:yes gene_type:complete